MRNTKVVVIVTALCAYNIRVGVLEPWIDVDEAREEYVLECLQQEPAYGAYSAIVLAVGHRQFAELREAFIKAFGEPNAVLYNVKGLLPLGAADGRL